MANRHFAQRGPLKRNRHGVLLPFRTLLLAQLRIQEHLGRSFGESGRR